MRRPLSTGDHPGTGGTGPPLDGGTGRGTPGAGEAYVSR